MWPTISDGLAATRRIAAVALAAAAGIALSAAHCRAQTWSSPRAAPAWGQLGAPAWGQYQGAIGANGWQYNKTQQPTDPTGAILNPNQLGGGPGTGTLYTPSDTRRRGRTIP